MSFLTKIKVVAIFFFKFKKSSIMSKKRKEDNIYIGYFRVNGLFTIFS